MVRRSDDQVVLWLYADLSIAPYPVGTGSGVPAPPSSLQVEYPPGLMLHIGDPVLVLMVRLILEQCTVRQKGPNVVVS